MKKKVGSILSRKVARQVSASSVEPVSECARSFMDVSTGVSRTSCFDVDEPLAGKSIESATQHEPFFSAAGFLARSSRPTLLVLIRRKLLIASQ